MKTLAPSDLLRREYARRKAENSRYSLRKFATALNIEHSTLSRYLKNERAVSLKAEKKIFTSLGMFTPDMTPGTPSPLIQCAPEFADELRHWYYDAILELTHTKNFRPNIRWIANALCIDLVETRIAVENLTRAGLLDVKGARWCDVIPDATTESPGMTTPAKRALQREILRKAERALDDIPADERSQTSVTIAIEAGDMDEVRTMIRNFRLDVIRKLQAKGKRPDTVYQLSVSFFPLTASSDEED